MSSEAPDTHPWLGARHTPFSREVQDTHPCLARCRIHYRHWTIWHIGWCQMILCHTWSVPGGTVESLSEAGGQWCPSGVQHQTGQAHPVSDEALLPRPEPGETRPALHRLVSPSGPYQNPAWASPGSVFRLDLVGLVLAQNSPALCRPTLAGPCLTTVVLSGNPALSSGSVFRPDPV